MAILVGRGEKEKQQSVVHLTVQAHRPGVYDLIAGESVFVYVAVSAAGVPIFG